MQAHMRPHAPYKLADGPNGVIVSANELAVEVMSAKVAPRGT